MISWTATTSIVAVVPIMDPSSNKTHVKTEVIRLWLIHKLLRDVLGRVGFLPHYTYAISTHRSVQPSNNSTLVKKLLRLSQPASPRLIDSNSAAELNEIDIVRQETTALS